MQQFCRTEMLVGKQAQEKLINSHVAVFGLGGVGSYTAEALARVGVGTLTLVDCDVVEESNINRQLYALHSTVGLPKTQVAKQRICDINPNAKVNALSIRFDATTAPLMDFSSFDYVVDAIDTVTSKLLLAELCHKAGTPIVSCMGTGNKLDATAFRVEDIFRTSVCPLAKVMRKKLKEMGIPSLKVVYSTELPCRNDQSEKRTPASISFVPPVAGMILAGEVIKDIIKQ